MSTMPTLNREEKKENIFENSGDAKQPGAGGAPFG